MKLAGNRNAYIHSRDVIHTKAWREIDGVGTDAGVFGMLGGRARGAERRSDSITAGANPGGIILSEKPQARTPVIN